MNQNNYFFLGALIGVFVGIIVGAIVTFIVLFRPFQQNLSIKEIVTMQQEFVDKYIDKIGEEIEKADREEKERKKRKENIPLKEDSRFIAFDTNKPLKGYNCVKVKNVLYQGKAIVNQQEMELENKKLFNLDNMLLFIEGRNFYDAEEVSAPKGKAFYVIGTYRYGDTQTLPVVTIQ